jgi:hypothetical protein
MRLGAAPSPDRQRQPGAAEIVHDGSSRAQLGELLEDQLQPRLDRLIRVEADRPVGVADKADGQPQVQLAPAQPCDARPRAGAA